MALGLGRPVQSLPRHLLKLVALSVAGITLYFALYDPDYSDEDRVLLVFSSIFFVTLFIGSFFSAKYALFAVGAGLLLNVIQGAVTGKITSVFRSYHGPTDIHSASDMYWLGMALCFVFGIGFMVYAYRAPKQQAPDPALKQRTATTAWGALIILVSVAGAYVIGRRFELDYGRWVVGIAIFVLLTIGRAKADVYFRAKKFRRYLLSLPRAKRIAALDEYYGGLLSKMTETVDYKQVEKEVREKMEQRVKPMLDKLEKQKGR